MPKTTSIRDCQSFADAITAAGGVVPSVLARLLAAHQLLAAPAPTRRPEEAIMTAALDGTLDEKTLSKLLPIAASAAKDNAYRQELARSAEHTLVGQFHRELEGGAAADQILDSLRERFDVHASAIADARSLIDPESDAETILAGGQPQLVTAWQGLNEHLRVIGAIAAVASAFGPRLGPFSRVAEYPLGDGFRLVDAAIMCCDGRSLELDSAPFQRPDQGHRSSPWFKVQPLKLHSIESARARYNRWAADQWDTQHSGPQGGWIGADGVMHEHPRPENPYRASTLAKR